MGPIKWPPKLIRTDVLGEVRDVSGRKTNRDIGRATQLGNNTYYLFGDTFCHDRKGNFCGVSNNTIAHVPDPVHDPTKSEYLDGRDYVGCFVPYGEGEYRYSIDRQGREQQDRTVLWVFGGIVEDREGCGTGWVFHDKATSKNSAFGDWNGMGVARVHVQPDKSVRVDRVMGENMIFGPNEPHFGSTNAFADDDGWVYLMGGFDPKEGDGRHKLDLRCHMARIRRDADFTRRENYEFFVNSPDMQGQWVNDYGNVDNLAKLGDLDIQGQGAIFKAPGFAPEGRPYIWIGVNKFMVGHLYIGCASKITGPWEVQDLGELPNDPAPWDGHSSGPKYALYPNPRASDMSRGEMLCTWSDGAQLGGKVIAARFYLEGNYERPPPPPPPPPSVQPGQQQQHHSIPSGWKNKLKRDFMGGIFNK